MSGFSALHQSALAHLECRRVGDVVQQDVFEPRHAEDGTGKL